MLKECFLTTTNVVRFNEICDEVEDPAGLIGPSLLEVTGSAGRGKSETAKKRTVNTDAIYLPPMNQRTPLMLLREITFELNQTKPGRIELCLDMIGREMSREPRLIIIDEADLLPMPLLEMIRNVNERYSCPILLIGEDGLAGKLASRRRLSSRIRLKMEFGPVSQADIGMFFNKALDLELSPSVTEVIQKYSKGDWRPVLSLAASVDRARSASGFSELTKDIVKRIIDEKDT